MHAELVLYGFLFTRSRKGLMVSLRTMLVCELLCQSEIPSDDKILVHKYLIVIVFSLIMQMPSYLE
jgi:hypothetical protein